MEWSETIIFDSPACTFRFWKRYTILRGVIFFITTWHMVRLKCWVALYQNLSASILKKNEAVFNFKYQKFRVKVNHPIITHDQNFVGFLVDLKTPKFPFEIKWPLAQFFEAPWPAILQSDTLIWPHHLFLITGCGRVHN